MSNLEALPESATLLDVFALLPEVARHANALTEAVLRGAGVLSHAEREFLFAYGSGLNACRFCHGIHTEVAQRLGVAPGRVAQALEDLDSAAEEPRFKALLGFVRKLNDTPARVTRRDADAVRAAGWSDAALHEAILVCALSNFFNRWVDGTGVDADAQFFGSMATRLASSGYATSGD